MGKVFLCSRPDGNAFIIDDMASVKTFIERNENCHVYDISALPVVRYIKADYEVVLE